MASGNSKMIRNRIIAIIAAAAVVIAALFAFMGVNTERIVSQNGEYLETSTGQTARRVDDLFANSLRNVQSAASVYGNSLTGPNVDPMAAVNILDLSQFDHSFFITTEGMAYNRDGRVESALDRTYYDEGIKGNSGICFIDNAIFDGQNVLSFYAPVFYENEVVGIISCVYRESTLTDYMSTSFYDQQTPTYLCQPDGEIIAKAAQNDFGARTIDEAFANEDLQGISIQQMNADIANGESTSFTYTTSEGTGNTYLLKLASFDMMLIRSFPASVTNEMLMNANISGVILVGGVLLAALLIIIVLVVQSRKQNKELLLERQAATRIIDASTNLFSRLLLVDLEDDEYEYLKAYQLDSNVPVRGKYSELRKFWESTAADSDRDTVIQYSSPDFLRDELKPGVPFLQYEYRSHREKGEFWLQMSELCVERDENDKPKRVLITVQDVTDAKAQELANHTALEEAFQAAEYASQAKSDFLNSMSHDIRTPMNSIMGMTAIASMHVDDTERVKECLSNITSASKHLLGLINEVLDMAKIESGAITLSEEAFDLPETMESLLTIVHPQILAKDQNLKVDLVGIQHEHVIGDPTRLQQVFVNIIGNSIKFTPNGGDITLRIEELPSRIADCACYEFTFSDTGCGMSPEFLETVFEPFTRANDSRVTKVEGTGLGMSIVKSVVNLMNGTIDVESEEGVGTTFTVTVHLKLRDGAEEDLTDLQDVRILVVDDDDIACEAACAMLDSIGMRAEFSLSGAEGVEHVVEADVSDDPFRAVILDWQMPGMSGIEVARAIRERISGRIPIIIFSGYDWSMIEQEARNVGVDAFISKPLFRTRLIQVLKELISGKVMDPTSEAAMLEECSFEGRRILLTEDNEMAAAIAEEIIGMTGADVERARDGKQSYEMVRDHEPGYYDLVLMDIQMPVMNGYEATKAIRGEAISRPDMGEIPIIALSADAFADDVKRSESAGMNAHMAKPLEIEPLVRTLKQWLLED
ncbi:MAG: response regulator [Eggerthellaceae bacterium]|nr:response regulator [Eggerthellaceae bacterium]